MPGLEDALAIPNGKVCSIYSPKYVDRTLHCLRNTVGGNAIFTFPDSPVKCPGAPQKILYISEHYFRKVNKNVPQLSKITNCSESLLKNSNGMSERSTPTNVHCPSYKMQLLFN